MKATVSLLTCLTAWALPLIAQGKSVEGYLILSEGTRIPFVGLRGSLGHSTFPVIEGKLNGMVLRQTLGEEILAVRYSEGQHATVLGVSGKSAALENVALWVSSLRIRELCFEILDPVTDRIRINVLPIEDIAAIIVTAGSFNQNTKTGRLYPIDYVFDPIDGSRLQVSKSPAATQPAVTRCCPSCFAVTSVAVCGKCGSVTLVPRTNLAEKPVDYFIRQAGLDPASDRAVAAKRYVRAWFNPFAGEDQIIASLKELVASR